MAGRRIELFARRTFELTDVAASQTMTVELIDRLAVEGAERGTLLVRAHSADLSGGGEMSVVLQQTAPTSEDPSVDFIGTDLVSTGVVGSAPGLKVGGVDLSGVGMLRVVLEATQSGGGGTLTADVSAELVLKGDAKP